MWNWVLTELLKPALRRLGTALGAYLVGAGVAADTVDLIVGGVLAAIGVAFDLFMSNRDRKGGE